MAIRISGTAARRHARPLKPSPKGVPHGAIPSEPKRDQTTLAGTYTYEKIQRIAVAQSKVTADASGNARMVINQDGTVNMTLDPAPITMTSTTSGFASATVKIPGAGRTFLWVVDAAAPCT